MSPAPEISDARLAANRENARLSTGPKSAEGKSRVRLNGLQHGLTGDTVVMPYEDAAQYQSFVAAILETLRPEGAAEDALAHSIADGRWRLKRARAVEGNVFALGAARNPVELDEDAAINACYTEAQTFLENARQLQLLTLYEGRIDRAVRRDTAELKELQTARMAAYQKALEEAALLHQLNASVNEPQDAAQSDGFGFSDDFLTRYVDRQTRLAEARRLFATPRIHSKPRLRKAA